MSESRGFPAELLSFLLFGVLGGSCNGGSFGMFCAADGRAGLLRQCSADTCHNSRVHGQPAVCTDGSVS